MRAPKVEDSQAEVWNESRDGVKDRVSDVILGAIFVSGGVYIIFAFSSFWVFLIGFFCVVLGVSMTLGGLPPSVWAEVPKNAPRSSGAELDLLRVLSKEGPISPAEAAIEVEISIHEADATLSELASRGHLKVESCAGTLFYSIPKRETTGSLEDS